MDFFSDIAQHLVLEVQRRPAADGDRAALQLWGLRAVARLPRRLARVVLPHPLHQAHVAVWIRRAGLMSWQARQNVVSYHATTS